MVQGIIIPASDAKDMRTIELAELKDYRKVVGRWIEAVDVFNFGCTMFLNGEGLIRGLPYNRRATYLWWYHVPQARGQARLAGDAVLVGLPDRDGRSTDVPTVVCELMLGATMCQVELQRLKSSQWRAAPTDPQTYIEAIVGATFDYGVRPGAFTPCRHPSMTAGGGPLLSGAFRRLFNLSQ